MFKMNLKSSNFEIKVLAHLMLNFTWVIVYMKFCMISGVHVSFFKVLWFPSTDQVCAHCVLPWTVITSEVNYSALCPLLLGLTSDQLLTKEHHLMEISKINKNFHSVADHNHNRFGDNREKIQCNLLEVK